jgi:5'-nucleotidase/UDP-sugar diphosphatase
MRPFVALVILLAVPAFAETRVTLLHFSDYHSHALPFFSEGLEEQGGLARAIPYMAKAKAAGALVLSGGDMINKGSPAWSDKYGCVEWSWLNGIVDAMAFGNHDADYGIAAYDLCRDSVRYPILGGNVVERGKALPASHLFVVHGIRIGVFAIAGSDFKTLVKVPELAFTDRLEAARTAVRHLRDDEHADAVVMIGHEGAEEDVALARTVPGIDLILGSHSHHKEELTKIEGTSVWFISPFQYLTYISRVELTFDKHKLTAVHGELVRVDRKLPVDAKVAKRVATLQRELEHDPKYSDLFANIGTAAGPLAVDGQTVRDAPLGDLVMDVMRRAAGADVALSTASSFRQSIAAGPIAMEELRAAMPYENDILVYDLTGEQLGRLLAYSASRYQTDSFAQVSGVRFVVDRFHDAAFLTIADAAGKHGPLDKGKTYRVATTDFLARVAPGYRDLLAGLTPKATGLRVRDEVRKYIASHSPVSARRDGRISEEEH